MYTPEKKHLFISYSRKDRVFVDMITNDLQREGLLVWRDTENLIAGTPNWEKTLRLAIKNAAAVILIASPFAMESEYVHGELALAKLYQCPIYPIWANGSNWLDCIPLDMTKLQYVDGRGENYLKGLAELKGSLGALYTNSNNIVNIGLPDHDVLSYDVTRYSTIGEFLNKVYMFHLNPWFEAFTYGKSWALGNVQTKQLVLPWEWLIQTQKGLQNFLYQEWLNDPLDKYKIKAGDYWGVWEITRFPVACICINSIDLYEKILNEDTLVNISKAFSEGLLEIGDIAAVTPANYKFCFFVGLVGAVGQIVDDHIKEKVLISAPNILLVEAS